MSDFDLGGLGTFWTRRSDDILDLVVQHVAVVVLSVILAAVIGIAIGIAVWNRPVSRSITIAAAGVALTIPSLALLALLTPVLGLGWTPTVCAKCPRRSWNPPRVWACHPRASCCRCSCPSPGPSS